MIHRHLLLVVVLILGGCSQSSKTDVFNPETSPYFRSSDKLIEVDGLTMRYRDEGPKDAATLVMIHGFTSSLESWDALSEALSSDYRIIRLDLPGHGLTGPDEQERYTNEDTVKFIAGFLDELGLETPVIIGNSLGGLTAWRYAASHPYNVQALVLISPGGFSINGVTDDPVDVPVMIKFYLTKAPDAGVKQALEALYGDPEKLPKTRIKSFRDMMQVPGNGEAFVKRAATFTLPDPTQDLKSLSVPTLLLWGDKDIMVPVTHADNFVDAISNAKLTIYESAGHIPQEETPGRVAEDIRAFLAELSP